MAPEIPTAIGLRPLEASAATHDDPSVLKFHSPNVFCDALHHLGANQGWSEGHGELFHRNGATGALCRWRLAPELHRHDHRASLGGKAPQTAAAVELATEG
jgi:hypothetical protein